jgi:Ca2+-binding RTX toxin-like protein
MPSVVLTPPPGSVTGTNNDTDGGAFNYTVTGGALTDTASGVVTVDTSGQLDGNGSDNILIGNDSGTTLNAGGGNDILIGNGGNDTLEGSTGNDTYAFDLDDGADTIQESSGTDQIWIFPGSTTLTGLNFEHNTTNGNLVILFNGQSINVTDHFDNANEEVESISFNGGSVSGYALGNGNYALSSDDDSNRQAAAGVDTVLAGDSGAETLTGNTGNDLIFGNGGTDQLVGDAGDDLLVGGLGTDTIDAGAGLDWLVYAEAVIAGNQDTINNYNGDGASKDTIDLSALLDANFGGGSNVADFARLQDAGGGNINLQVDIDGTGAGATFATVAVLSGYNTTGNIVSTYFGGAEQQLQVA